MSLLEQIELDGRDCGGTLEYVVTFRASYFQGQVWPAIQQALEEQKFEDLEALIEAGRSGDVEGSGLLAAFLSDLRRWRPDCRQEGRYPGNAPFCRQPSDRCRDWAEQGYPMCGMKDCYRRLTQVVVRLCQPAVTMRTLLAATPTDVATLCDAMTWAVADEEHAQNLFGSPLIDFPPELNRTSMSVYLTHMADESQVAHAAKAGRNCRDLLHADLDLGDGQLEGVEEFWKAAARHRVGLALCYAEP